ncbi:MAG: hypothetical protein GX263_10455 [Firmicutes bacterium]|jgi:trans-aconitate methyltransferase|nr:hypothetical protein [Bacillota bacterium]
MVKWINQPSIVPFLKILPKEKQSQFRDEVVRRMVYKTVQPDGTYFEAFRRINTSMQKSKAQQQITEYYRHFTFMGAMQSYTLSK